MHVYDVSDRTQATLWNIRQAAIPTGGGRARVHLNGTLSSVHMGETLNFAVNERHTGLVTRGLTFCAAVCIVRIAGGAMDRVAMNHVIGGEAESVDWGSLMRDIAAPQGAVLKAIVAWNEGARQPTGVDAMTRAIRTHTPVADSNIYHYLSNAYIGIGGTWSASFALQWPCYAGEW